MNAIRARQLPFRTGPGVYFGGRKRGLVNCGLVAYLDKPNGFSLGPSWPPANPTLSPCLLLPCLCGFLLPLVRLAELFAVLPLFFPLSVALTSPALLRRSRQEEEEEDIFPLALPPSETSGR